MVIIK